MDIKSLFSNDWSRICLRSLRTLSLDITLKVWDYLGLPGEQNERVIINSIAKRYFHELIKPAKRTVEIHIPYDKAQDVFNRFQQEIVNDLGEGRLKGLLDWIRGHSAYLVRNTLSYDVGVFYRFLREPIPPSGLENEKLELIQNKILQELITPLYSDAWDEINDTETSEWDRWVDNFSEIEDFSYGYIYLFLTQIAVDNIWKFLTENFSEDDIKKLNFPVYQKK